ncbi:MAG: excisionase [Nitrospirae bacterium]|nr:excisionase [Nitrospirota bacterium]
MSERLLTLRQAEEQTGRKISSWRRDILERRIACVRLGRSVRIPQTEIDRLIREGFSPRIETGGRAAR